MAPVNRVQSPISVASPNPSTWRCRADSPAGGPPGCSWSQQPSPRSPHQAGPAGPPSRPSPHRPPHKPAAGAAGRTAGTAASCRGPWSTAGRRNRRSRSAAASSTPGAGPASGPRGHPRGPAPDPGPPLAPRSARPPRRTGRPSTIGLAARRLSRRSSPGRRAAAEASTAPRPSTAPHDQPGSGTGRSRSGRPRSRGAPAPADPTPTDGYRPGQGSACAATPPRSTRPPHTRSPTARAHPTRRTYAQSGNVNPTWPHCDGAGWPQRAAAGALACWVSPRRCRCGRGRAR